MRRLLPIVLILLGLWLFTGCFTIPTFEHADRDERDFRELMGGPKTDRPIRIGQVTRGRILQLLGEPLLLDPAGNAIGYQYTAVRSVTVYPLCFFASTPSSKRVYTVRFDFDQDAVLQHWQIEQTDSRVHHGLLGFPYPRFDNLPTLGLQSRYTLAMETNRHAATGPTTVPTTGSTTRDALDRR